MKRGKKAAWAVVLLTALALLGGCKQNPPQERLYAKLVKHFEERGFACALLDEPPSEAMPIGGPSDWKALEVGTERVFVYFDESNRADYLSEQVDRRQYEAVAHFGLRFVLYYPGTDEEVLEALEEMDGALTGEP